MISTIGAVIVAGLALAGPGNVRQRIVSAVFRVFCWLVLCVSLAVFWGFANFAADNYVRNSDPYWQRSYESAEEYQERISTLTSE